MAPLRTPLAWRKKLVPSKRKRSSQGETPLRADARKQRGLKTARTGNRSPGPTSPGRATARPEGRALPMPDDLVVGGAAPGELHRRRLGGTLGGPEDDLALALVLGVRLGVDDDGLAGSELLPQDLLRDRVLDQALDRPPERPGAERGVVPLLRQEVLGGVGQLDGDVLALELVPHPPDH